MVPGESTTTGRRPNIEGRSANARALPESHTVVLTRGDVRRLLSLPECIDAVEQAFVAHDRGRTIAPGVLGTHVDGGGFHVKTAGMLSVSVQRDAVYAAKINANFPGNPVRNGRPTIQGVIALFDAGDGRLLALLDSGEITSVRTAAATAVAARHLARADASVATICGCGEQARHQLRAVSRVRPLRRVFAHDSNDEHARAFAAAMSAELGIEVECVGELTPVTRDSDIWITCTPSRRWILGRKHVAPGAFIAAVGADWPEKQEIEPELLASNVVVPDLLEQAASIGDLHHAIEAGLMTRAGVRAELGAVVSGRTTGRRSTDEIIVFDSTGTALQDVAAALLAYERARAAGIGLVIDLGNQ